MRRPELSKDTGVTSIKIRCFTGEFSIGHAGIDSTYPVKPMRLPKEFSFLLFEARS